MKNLTALAFLLVVSVSVFGGGYDSPRDLVKMEQSDIISQDYLVLDFHSVDGDFLPSVFILDANHQSWDLSREHSRQVKRYFVQDKRDTSNRVSTARTTIRYLRNQSTSFPIMTFAESHMRPTIRYLRKLEITDTGQRIT